MHRDRCILFLVLKPGDLKMAQAMSSKPMPEKEFGGCYTWGVLTACLSDLLVVMLIAREGQYEKFRS